MPLRPIVRSLVVPILGLSVSGFGKRPDLAESEGEPAPPAAKVVNINQTGALELRRLPGIGIDLANRIVKHRREHGAFRRPEDLMQIKGIGEKFFRALRPYVAVTGPTTLAEKVRSRA